MVNKMEKTVENKMVKHFDKDPTNIKHAIQIWQILVSKANNRQIVTYGMVADLLGFKGAGVLAHSLGPIMHYCEQNKLPPLTAIVVNQDTGLPGEGLEVADLNAAREKVFNYNWFNLIPPSETLFIETQAQDKVNSKVNSNVNIKAIAKKMK